MADLEDLGDDSDEEEVKPQVNGDGRKADNKADLNDLDDLDSDEDGDAMDVGENGNNGGGKRAAEVPDFEKVLSKLTGRRVSLRIAFHYNAPVCHIQACF